MELTRKQAIEELKAILEMQYWNVPLSRAALEMAIKDLEQELCGDCISRKATINYFNNFRKKISSMPLMDVVDRLKDLPSVTPLESRRGHWIKVHPLQENDEGDYMCSECRCGGLVWKPTTYCPNCGANMVEPQESEDKE